MTWEMRAPLPRGSSELELAARATAEAGRQPLVGHPFGMLLPSQPGNRPSSLCPLVSAGKTNGHAPLLHHWHGPGPPCCHEWINKMWCIYTVQYYSAIKRNKTGLFVVMWMNLESVIQSKVSQKEKNKYHILTHIWNLEKCYRRPICRAVLGT